MENTTTALLGNTISAFIGVILGFSLTICWDLYKNHRKFKDLIWLVLNEMEANLKRMDDVIENLPEGIKVQVEKNGDSVSLDNSEIETLPWSFPKPYITEAWHTFILSGFASKLPKDTLLNLYKAYDQIHSINFLGDISVSLFQILSQQNRLDNKTNKIFDKFCRIGTLAQQFIARKQSKQVIEDLKKLLK